MTMVSTPAVEPSSTLPWGGAPFRAAQLLRWACPDTVLKAWIGTGTRVDTGGWFLGTPVGVAIVDDAIILVAPGARPLLQRLPFARLDQSFYNHVTGELILAPTTLSRVPSLRVTPDDAVRIIRFIRREAD